MIHGRNGQSRSSVSKRSAMSNSPCYRGRLAASASSATVKREFADFGPDWHYRAGKTGGLPMPSGDFAIGLMTIITGLAIADMVASTHLLLMHRARVQWDW